MRHIIVDLNLKGLSYAVTGDLAMMEISAQLRQQLSLFDMGLYSDLYDCTSKHCFVKELWG